MLNRLPCRVAASLGLGLLVSLTAFSTQGLAGASLPPAGKVALQPAPTPMPGMPLPGSRSRTFPETGKTVRGIFLDYWEAHGGLPQQGYPVSEAFAEVSDLDGKTYTVQYFERAVFEYHPENRAPTDVLLSQLGTFRYQKKYPNGAPGQQPNTSAGSRLFEQTGKRVGGPFLQYWQQNGGLAQQGYPISDEFQEKSELDGKTYRVQYFERAVFELHPDEKPPYNVLLSQLGTFRLRDKYPNGPPVEPTVPPGPGGSKPAPTSTPTNPACAGIPEGQNMTITPNCGTPRSGFTMRFVSRGFKPGEVVQLTATTPDGLALAVGSRAADAQGVVEINLLIDRVSNWPRGLYTVVAEGDISGKKGTGYFKIIAAGSN
ncbi:MAG TPA: hypothetical protein VFH60_09385 [Chloroflexia bacterium]|nr:hypothetical protein [Chloroflexia bacterium]